MTGGHPHCKLARMIWLALARMQELNPASAGNPGPGTPSFTPLKVPLDLPCASINTARFYHRYFVALWPCLSSARLGEMTSNRAAE